MNKQVNYKNASSLMPSRRGKRRTRRSDGKRTRSLIRRQKRDYWFLRTVATREATGKSQVIRRRVGEDGRGCAVKL